MINNRLQRDMARYMQYNKHLCLYQFTNSKECSVVFLLNQLNHTKHTGVSICISYKRHLQQRHRRGNENSVEQTLTAIFPLSVSLFLSFVPFSFFSFFFY